jgi:hypothetical protein
MTPCALKSASARTRACATYDLRWDRLTLTETGNVTSNAWRGHRSVSTTNRYLHPHGPVEHVLAWLAPRASRPLKKIDGHEPSRIFRCPAGEAPVPR